MATTATAPKRGLGKGLSALMGDTPRPDPLMRQRQVGDREDVDPVLDRVATRNHPGAVLNMPIERLQSGKYQPRRRFDEESLSELADSLEKHGIMQPLVVRLLGEGKYEIIAGERRWRAAQLVKLAHVPVIVRALDDAEALELALIENIQRADLNPLEEAAGYARLMDEFHYTQETLSKTVGKSRSHIANLLRLLKLPEGIRRHIDSGALSMGHARALASASDPEAVARQVVEGGLSVRQAEMLAAGKPLEAPTAPPATAASPARAPREPVGTGKTDDVLQLEGMLSDSLGLKVRIDTRGGQAGDVIITYESLTQLDEILKRLGGGNF